MSKAMNELVIISTLNPLTAFAEGGLDPIISKIEQEVRSVVLDISTDRGRKQVASLAYKIAQSKTALDELGKNLTEEWKTKSKAVDAERKRMREKLDALKEEIRAPLTEWEDAENARIAKHEENLSEIIASGRFTLENWQSLSPEVMRERLDEVAADTSLEWQEFSARAKLAIEETTAAIKSAIQKRETYDAEQAELARLRQDEAVRKQREHEERLQAEAAAKAKAEAEAAARAEAEALAVKVKAEQEAAARREEAARREKAEAEERASKAEEARLAAEAKAAADAIAAMEKAEREADAAARREREKIESERKAEAEELAKREADKKHKARINNEIRSGFVAAGLADNVARIAIEAMAKKQVPHVSINY